MTNTEPLYITLEVARSLLRRAANTQAPDFRYIDKSKHSGCYYSTDTFHKANSDYAADMSDDPRSKTGCLIGVALDLAGYTKHHESTETIQGLWEEGTLIDSMDFDAVQYFTQAQVAQDNGDTWESARAKAEAYYYTYLSPHAGQRNSAES